jgi:hypothetical protein
LTSLYSGKVLICKIDWENITFSVLKIFFLSVQCIGQLDWYSVSWKNWFVKRVARRVPQELLSLPEHLSSPPIFSGIRVARYFVSCVMLCR